MSYPINNNFSSIFDYVLNEVFEEKMPLDVLYEENNYSDFLQIDNDIPTSPAVINSNEEIISTLLPAHQDPSKNSNEIQNYFPLEEPQNDNDFTIKMLASFLKNENLLKATFKDRNEKIKEILRFKITGINSQTISNLYAKAVNKANSSDFTSISYNKEDFQEALLMTEIILPKDPVYRAVYHLSLEKPTYKSCKLSTIIFNSYKLSSKIFKNYTQLNREMIRSEIIILHKQLFQKIIPENLLPKEPLNTDLQTESIRILVNYIIQISSQKQLVKQQKKRRIETLSQDVFYCQPLNKIRIMNNCFLPPLISKMPYP